MKADIKYTIVLLNLNHVVTIPPILLLIKFHYFVAFGSLDGPLGPLALYCKVRALLLVKVG